MVRDKFWVPSIRQGLSQGQYFTEHGEKVIHHVNVNINFGHSSSYGSMSFLFPSWIYTSSIIFEEMNYQYAWFSMAVPCTTLLQSHGITSYYSPEVPGDRLQGQNFISALYREDHVFWEHRCFREILLYIREFGCAFSFFCNRVHILYIVLNWDLPMWKKIKASEILVNRNYRHD